MERCLTLKEAADVLRVGVATLRRWRYAKQGPECSKIGRQVLYTPAAIQKFLQEKKEAIA